MAHKISKLHSPFLDIIVVEKQNALLIILSPFSMSTIIGDIGKFVSKAKDSNQAFKLHFWQNSNKVLENPLSAFRAKSLTMLMVVPSNKDKGTVEIPWR